MKTSVEVMKELALEVWNYFGRSHKSDGFTITRNKKIAPLHIVVEQENLKLCEHILDRMKDKNPKADMKLFYRGVFIYRVTYAPTPLHIAAFKGHSQMCSLMIGHIDVKEFDVDTFTPLHIAAIAGHLNVFKVIMESQIEKNPANQFGETPLHLAALQNHFDICKLIISNVKNIHPTTKYVKTPKDYAIVNGNWEIIKLFEP